MTIRCVTPDDEENAMNRQDEKRRDESREAGEPDTSDRPDATSGHSKDAFFARVAALADEMIEHHDREFAMGTLVLAAKFIAEGRPLSSSTDDGHVG